LKIAATGFVEANAGSVASANALLLKGLLARGHSVDFFSKRSFVDPRPVIGDHVHFRFYDCTNHGPDLLRRRTQGVPLLSFLTEQLDARTYNQLLVTRIRKASQYNDGGYDVVLWLGDFAHGAVPGVPTVSFAQGPPGTDARSILRRRDEIRKLAGRPKAMQLEVLARLRVSKLGLPALRCSDHIIVGSRQSCRTLTDVYGVAADRLSALPYPIDLEFFHSRATSPPPRGKALRVLWLGRIIPRKRLDLLLDAAALAVERGLNISLTVVGGIGFVPGYEKLIRNFRYPERLRWIPTMPRENVPNLLAEHDVLCQPSEEENFGSSVAEAQACGLPVIVGQSNGNADYLCERDVHLEDYRPQTLADAFALVSRRITVGDTLDRDCSGHLAENCFRLERVVASLEQQLGAICR
jgi:glycosyltransferase involved in cell wall biosynthesis